MRADTFRVKPKLAYHILGTNIRLDTEKVYLAEHACNQPNWQERQAIFVQEDIHDPDHSMGVLLEKGEYTIVEESA